jgi:hypothetical protein
VYIVERASRSLTAIDNKVRFGDEVRIKSNNYICHKNLYLHSQPISPLAYARFSRNQEVCLHSNANYNTVWRILPTPGNGFYNDVIKSGVPIVLEHCGTQQNLSNDRIAYKNDFGDEFEVSAKAKVTMKKTQMCEKERIGETVRENTSKDITSHNYWTFELATDANFTPEEASKMKYSGIKLVGDVREALSNLHLLALSGLMLTFSKMDKSKDGQLQPDELKKGLEAYQIFLNDEQVDALLADFDKDKSGAISFEEFANVLMVSGSK